MSHEHALEDLGEVPEVKGVVRLGWGGEELRRDGGVDGSSGLDQLGDHHLGIREGREPRGDDR